MLLHIIGSLFSQPATTPRTLKADVSVAEDDWVDEAVASRPLDDVDGTTMMMITTELDVWVYHPGALVSVPVARAVVVVVVRLSSDNIVSDTLGLEDEDAVGDVIGEASGETVGDVGGVMGSPEVGAEVEVRLVRLVRLIQQCSQAQLVMHRKYLNTKVMVNLEWCQ